MPVPLLERVTLPREPATPRRARHYLAPRLYRLGMHPEAVDELLLAVGEAVTNAVVHGGVGLTPADPRQAEGGGPPAVTIPDVVMVELITRDDYVVIAVTSPSERWRVPTGELPSDPEAPGGRGLFLMRQFTDALRIEQGRRGTTVYLIRRVRPGRLDETRRRRPVSTSPGHRRAG